jgi:hypothetical protein
MMRMDLFKMRLLHFIITAMIFLAIAVQNVARADDDNSRFVQLIGQYANIQTVNLTAQNHKMDNTDQFIGTNNVAAPPATISNIDFTYTADHEKYILINKSNLYDTAFSNTMFAYNGQRLEILNTMNQTLSYQHADRDYIFPGMDNPFFDSLYFLDLSSDQHEGYAIKLPYVQNPSTLKNLLALVQWVPLSANNPNAVAILPGSGTMSGLPFEYRIYFEGKIRFLPTRIERHCSNSANSEKYLFSRMDIQDYGVTMVAGKPFYWPRTIELSLRLGDAVLVDQQITVTSCLLNHPMNQNVFTINPGLAKSFVDWDANGEISNLVPAALVSAATNPVNPPSPATQSGATAPAKATNSSAITSGGATNPMSPQQNFIVRFVLVAAVVLIVVRLAMRIKQSRFRIIIRTDSKRDSRR